MFLLNRRRLSLMYILGKSCILRLAGEQFFRRRLNRREYRLVSIVAKSDYILGYSTMLFIISIARPMLVA